MRKLSYLLAMLAMCVLCGCEKSSKDAYLSVGTTELIFVGSGGSLTLSVNSDSDWSIMDAPTWLEFSVKSGINSQDVVVTAKPNVTGVLREGQFVVRTNNGSRQQVVNVRQSGDGDIDKFNVPDVSKRWLNGDNLTARGMDSIYIDANMPWIMEGPDWISAAFQGKSVVIDGQVEYTGSGYIKFVPRSRNEELEDRTGSVRIRSPYSQHTYEIPIVQLGVSHVVPTDPLLLADGYATQLKVGAGVHAIRAKIFEGRAKDSEITYEAANESWYLSQFREDAVIYESSLKPNTQYELCIWTISSTDYYWQDGLNRFTFTTPSNQNQPICDIQEVNYSNGSLTYNNVMNSAATGYYSFTMRSAEVDKSVFGWAMRDKIRQNAYDLKTKSGSYRLNYITTDVSLYTWAVNSNQQLSAVITSYGFKLGNETKSMKRKPVGVGGICNIKDIEEKINMLEYHK